MRGNMLIAQSGGPTAAVNASLAGAVLRAQEAQEIGKIYGARNGIEGLLKEDLVDLTNRFESEEERSLLCRTPAMALGSCRLRLSETPDETYEALLDILKKYGIRYFFYTGGNDSMDTVKKLSSYFSLLGEEIYAVGIPKTIDNDLGGTDHTPGFGSAAKYIATSVHEIFTDSEIYTPPSITVVEIMGRNAGWLTASSALARTGGCPAPHMICMPEVPFDMEKFIARAGELLGEYRHLIIAVSEGIRRSDGSYIASDDNLDPFGHQQLSGVGHRLGRVLRDRFGCKVRDIELNVLQRSAAHLQSETDIKEAVCLGAKAVELGISRMSGVMSAIFRISDCPYTVEYGKVDIEKVANVERTVPVEWIDREKMDIKRELVDYISPLIMSPSQAEPGVPRHLIL